MPGITGQGTTFDLPNFVGELFLVSPTDTPLITAIGGLTGGRQSTAKDFEWQFYALRDVEDRARLEGADAPDPENRVREYASNVVQIVHEAVEISYTKLSAVGQLDPASLTEGTNPVRDEFAFQVRATLTQIARDLEWAFINGTYAKPANNLAPRKTRGLLQAIATNVVDANGATLTRTIVEDALEAAWASGGLVAGDTRTLIVNAGAKRKLTDIYVTQAGFEQTSRNVGGANVTSIETDFGLLNIMLNRYMPTDEIAVVSLEELAPRFLLVPGKGFLFVEELGKTGSSDASQIYGEVGLEYGAEAHHAKITNIVHGYEPASS
jgi:hypothetical protein